MKPYEIIAQIAREHLSIPTLRRPQQRQPGFSRSGRLVDPQGASRRVSGGFASRPIGERTIITAFPSVHGPRLRFHSFLSPGFLELLPHP